MKGLSRLRTFADGLRTTRAKSGEHAGDPTRQGQSRLGRWFRRQSVGDRARWARRALEWPLVNWLEGVIWAGVAGTLGIAYYGSWDNQVLVFMALGYSSGPAHVVPAVVDAPLTVSVIGQFLLARWKSPARRRWRLGMVTVVTAPLSLAGNALHGAVVFDKHQQPYLDLALLDLSRLEVWFRLVAAMVPGIGIILAVFVTELVLRERARLEELREVAAADEVAPRSADATATSNAHHRTSEGSGTPVPGRAAKRAAGRLPASEVKRLVADALEQLTGELDRRPSAEEVAARVTANGHRIVAGRARDYMAQLKAEERSRAALPPAAGQEVVAWRSR